MRLAAAGLGGRAMRVCYMSIIHTRFLNTINKILDDIIMVVVCITHISSAS